MTNESVIDIILGRGKVESNEDIDIGKEVDYLRIERTSEDGFWFAGYADESGEKEFNFWVYTDDNGVGIQYEITTQVPVDIFRSDWG